MVLRIILGCVLAFIGLHFLGAVLQYPSPGAIAGNALVYGFYALLSIVIYRRIHAGDRANASRQK